MKKGKKKKRKAGRQKRKNYAFVGLCLLIALAVGGWYAYGHYHRAKRAINNAGFIESQYQFSDVNSTHLKAAKKCGITPVESRKQLNTKGLEKVETCKYYKVDRLTHSVPYLTPASKALLQSIGEDFQKELEAQGLRKHRIIVTSVLRTKEDVKNLQGKNRNATKDSAHQYATTFDITYTRFNRQTLVGSAADDRTLANILGKVLEKARNNGRCYVKYERLQHCFHITSRQ